MPADVLLLIEVADSSLEYDRGFKLALYAAAGIPELWIAKPRTGEVEPAPTRQERSTLASARFSRRQHQPASLSRYDSGTQPVYAPRGAIAMDVGQNCQDQDLTDLGISRLNAHSAHLSILKILPENPASDET